FSSRFGSYHQALDIFSMHPLSGVGIDQYNPTAKNLPTQYINGVNSDPNPHSSYLAVLAEIGVAGLAALLFLTIAVIRLIRALNRRRYKHSDALLAACVLGAALSYLLF